jgi:hypothetical protein
VFFSEIASLRPMHDDMSAKPCDNYKMIIVNYVDMWLLHSHIASLLDSARLDIRDLKARSTLLGACTSCPMLRSNLEASAVEIKDFKYKLHHSSYYIILSPPYVVCGSLKSKLFQATKENTELKQEVAYLTTRLKKTVLSEKMIKEYLSRIEESATKFIYKLGVGFERCEKKGEKSASKFVPNSNYHKKEEALKSTKTHYPSNPKTSFKPRVKGFICIFYGRAGHLNKFCFRHKRIVKRHFDYARNSYRDEFSDFLSHSFSRSSPRTSSRVLSRFSHGPNHRSYGFGS